MKNEEEPARKFYESLDRCIKKHSKSIQPDLLSAILIDKAVTTTIDLDFLGDPKRWIIGFVSFSYNRVYEEEKDSYAGEDGSS